MGRKKRLIVPIFIPFGGCPHQCVFCDQNGITGNSSLPEAKEVRETIETYLSTWRGGGPKEAAFYGGSFTGLPIEKQREYLECAFEFVKAGQLDSIRVSTRPDCVNEGVILMLKRYGVNIVELGAQSMDDGVLKLSGRGHTADDTRKAVSLLKDAGLAAGLQFMPGLPGDTEETILKTVQEIIALGPSFVRVYPSLVLKDTPLYRMYIQGLYQPWELSGMVKVCRSISALLKEAGIPIIRMGLQPTAELERSLAAGPYHPSFRQLVEEGA